jgi:hypothetical protein
MNKSEIDAGEGKAALDLQHHDATNEIRMTVFSILKYIRYIITVGLTWFCTVQYDRHYGSVINSNVSRNQIELENYSLKNDDVSAENIWRIVDEQKIQISNLQTKLHYRAETKKVMLGFLTNKKIYLEHALSINPDRENGFPFIEWNPDIVAVMLDFSINAFHREALDWVVRQPDWTLIVDDELVGRIKLFLADWSIDEKPPQ